MLQIDFSISIFAKSKMIFEPEVRENDSIFDICERHYDEPSFYNVFVDGIKIEDMEMKASPKTESIEMIFKNIKELEISLCYCVKEFFWNSNDLISYFPWKKFNECFPEYVILINSECDFSWVHGIYSSSGKMLFKLFEIDEFFFSCMLGDHGIDTEFFSNRTEYNNDMSDEENEKALMKMRNSYHENSDKFPIIRENIGTANCPRIIHRDEIENELQTFKELVM